MAESATPLAKGDIVAGKYRVLFVMGEGGMGHVYAAEHVQLGHKVALKVLRSIALASEESVERFLREGKAAARLQSEHVARVSDVGTLDSGLPYMVMEFLEGRDLAHLLVEQPKLPIDEAVAYIIQAGEAIAEAHRNGIVHRDLKPANLFVTTNLDGAPRIKVLDFGISKASSLVGAEAPQITSTAAMIGSPKYMSPEQMHDSRTVNERADIWALGAILYEMLAGRRAFDATTLAVTCVQILQEDPPPVRVSRPDVPPELDAVVMRCLKKDPDDRFSCVADLVEALAPFSPESQALVARIARLTISRPTHATPTGRRSGPSLSDVASSMAAVAAGRRFREDAPLGGSALERARKRSGRAFAIAGVAALFLVLALAGLNGDGPPRTTPQAAANAPIPPPKALATATDILVAPPPESPVVPAGDAGVAPVTAAPAVPPSQRRAPRARPSANPSGVTDSVLEDRR